MAPRCSTVGIGAALVGLGVMHGIARGRHLRQTDACDIVERYGPPVQAQLTPGG